MQASQVELPEIFAEASELASRHWRMLLGVFAAIVAGYSAIDWLTFQMEDPSGLAVVSMIAGMIVSIYLQYLVTERLLADRAPTGMAAPARRYGTLFVALLVSGLAIGAGSLLLILPGIYLAGRWLTLTPHLIEGKLGANDAMAASWDASYASQLAFAVTALLGFLPTIAAIVFSFGLDAATSGVEAIPALLATSMLTAIASVLGWVLSAAAYRKAVPITTQFDAVFS